MTEAGGMAEGIMGHPTCLPSPLLGTVLLAEDAVMLEQELGLPVVHAGQRHPPKNFLEVLREDPASSYLFQSLSLNPPAFQPLPATISPTLTAQLMELLWS